MLPININELIPKSDFLKACVHVQSFTLILTSFDIMDLYKQKHVSVLK